MAKTVATVTRKYRVRLVVDEEISVDGEVMWVSALKDIEIATFAVPDSALKAAREINKKIKGETNNG